MGNKFSDRNMGENSLRKKAQSLQEKVDNLEQLFGQLMLGIQEQSQRSAQNLGNLAEVTQALVELTGKKQVDELIESNRIIKAQADADRNQEELLNGVKDGYVTITDIIAPDSFLVGKEILSNGKVLGVGRQFVDFESLDSKYKEELLGKSVGAIIRTPVGGSFEVLEIYKLDRQKAREVFAERSKNSVEAAGEEAEADEGMDQ